VNSITIISKCGSVLRSDTQTTVHM